MSRVSSTFVSGAARERERWGGILPPHLYIDYEQLVEIILTDCTSRCGCMPWASPLRCSSSVPVVPAAPAVVPVAAPAVVVGSGEAAVVPAPAAEAVDVWFIDGSHVVLPVTWILWPTCLSRSFPPLSIQLIAGALDIDALALVPDVVAPAAAPVVPVVVVPDVVVVLLDAPLSIRALFSMNPLLLSRARQPVIVTSCDLSVVLVRWLAVVVLVCAPSVTAHATAAATPRPVAVRFILPSSSC